MSCAESGAVLTHLVLTIPAPGGSESGCGGAQTLLAAICSLQISTEQIQIFIQNIFIEKET